MYYGMGRVVGTIGYVPVEEYLFFLLQPILTGLWLYWLLPRTSEPVQQSVPQERVSGIVLWIALSCRSLHATVGSLVSTSG